MHGHGMYRIVERLMDEALDGPRRDSRREPPADIEQEVKILYARGDINSNTYHRLMEMAANGQLDWEDLARVRGEGLAPLRPEPKSPPRARDAEIVSSLNRLYTHRTRLEQARAESEQVLQRLEGDIERLQAQADAAEEKAQLALPDEEKARAYLEVKQEAVERIQALGERVASLHQDLRRIDTLRDELATREAELKALESSQQLAELEASIRQELLEPA